MIENPGQKRQFHTLLSRLPRLCDFGFFRKMQSFSESIHLRAGKCRNNRPFGCLPGLHLAGGRLYTFTSDRAAYALQLTPERQKRGLKPATTLGEPF